MALYLHCALCGRKQADGLLSGATWARVDANDPSAQTGKNAGAVRVCPRCQNDHEDWRSRVASGAASDLGSGGLGSAA